jgi:hypothetical protein
MDAGLLANLLFFQERENFYEIICNYLSLPDVVTLDEAIVNVIERSEYLEIMKSFPKCQREFYKMLEGMKKNLNSWMITRNMHYFDDFNIPIEDLAALSNDIVHS